MYNIDLIVNILSIDRFLSYKVNITTITMTYVLIIFVPCLNKFIKYIQGRRVEFSLVREMYFDLIEKVPNNQRGY